MAEFLTTQGTSYYIENIIKSAKNRLVLISPYLKLSKTFFERLKDADKRNVKITLVYGKDDLRPDEKGKLEQLKSLELYFREDLHAKCYFNEENMVITSMNMYEFSEKNNREMGVLIRSSEDKKVFNDAVQEVKSIISSLIKTELKPTGAKRVDGSSAKQAGYCIRCGMNIPPNLEKPLCFDCYEEWAKWKNPDYLEPFCHLCGQPEITTMEKPLCYSCYKKILK